MDAELREDLLTALARIRDDGYLVFPYDVFKVLRNHIGRDRDPELDDALAEVQFGLDARTYCARPR
jgi:hypothetical protein